MPASKKAITAAPGPLTIEGLRAAVEREPLLSQKLSLRVSAAEHDRLRRLADLSGTTPAHCARRLLAIASEALLADHQGEQSDG